MRLVVALLAAGASIAHADGPAWSEYGAATRLGPATSLVDAGCEIDVTLRGAIALVEQRLRLRNSGLEPLAATRELTLPAGARLVALEVQHGRSARAALAIAAPIQSERAVDPSVLGPDPALLVALGDDRYRVIVQPSDPEQETVVTLRWTRVADIRGGALHVALPAHEGKPCRGVLHATPGPGTSIARVRFGGVESAVRTFTLADRALPIAVDLSFRRATPVVWTQSERLGDGFTAQATTILAPPAPAPVARRVMFVIDTSRSMELIGRQRVRELVRAVGRALPAGTAIDAIVYDRTPARVFGAWRAVDAQQLAALETSLATHPARNGSDAAAALALARQASADAETLILHVSDGVFGDIADNALAHALGTAERIDLHAVVLTRGRLDAPDAAPLQAAVRHAGGSSITVDVEELDSALVDVAEWLAPAWLDVGLATGDERVPRVLRPGRGVVITSLVKRALPPVLTARMTAPTKIKAVAGPTAPIAELVLAAATADDAGDEATLNRLRTRRPSADEGRAFVVLSNVGRVARSRREVAASGGPFTRMVALPDPAFEPIVRVSIGVARGGSSIDRQALELMFRTQLQPAAFACYQRALARAPTLAGTARFRIEIGRGETTRAIVTGLGEPTLDACLLDAAYLVTPALPNPDFNVDDRTIANYPLTFSVREQKPFVLPGDADSQSPLDIDAIEGGPPARIKAGDTTTPLGPLRVPTSP